MKKRLLAALLAALVLTGCGAPAQPEDTVTEDVPPAEEVPETPPEPIRLECLAVEFAAKGGADILPALNRMPEKLQSALAEADVEVQEIRVTLAASQDTAARAVGEGSVDLSFLSAEGFLRAEAGGTALLGVAVPTLLCTSASDYGQVLQRQEDPTWNELAHGRWGVTEADGLVNLWLADRYEGRTLEDLPYVTVYGSREELAQAAAEGAVDVYAAESGEVVLAELEARYTQLAIVREDSPLTADILALAAVALAADEDWLRLTGGGEFIPLTESALDPLRRLIDLEEH